MGNFSVLDSVTTDDKIVTGDTLVGVFMLGVEGSGLYTYDQSTWTQLSSEPAGCIVRKHLGSFWVAGITDAPDVLLHRHAHTIGLGADEGHC